MVSCDAASTMDSMARLAGLEAETVACLQDLIRIPSVTGDEAAIGSHVATILRGMGFAVEVFEATPGRPNVLGTLDTGLPGPNLLLNDHLDIVPPGPLEDWRHPPFGAVIEDGSILGRGAIDTKSGVTTILMGAKGVLASGHSLCGRLQLLFTCDEEVGGALGIQHMHRIGRLQADLALVAEPTSLDIQIATKGRMNVEILTRGRATHGARPWLGHNAIEDMAWIVAELERLRRRLEEKRHPLLGPASLNVGLVAGGTVPNMVPSLARLQVDRRLIPGETQEAALAEFGDVLSRLRTERPGSDATLRQSLWWPGYVLDPDAPVIGLAARAFEAVAGRPARISGKDAGTDASWINTLAGIPVVMFSPGEGHRAMDANESVRIADLHLATAVVARFIHDILGTQEQP